MAATDDLTKLAQESITSTPWWVTAPVWLSAGIVGVPALIAIGAGYFLAHAVTMELARLDQYQQVELANLNQVATLEREHQDSMIHHWNAILRYMDQSLRADYAMCVNAAPDEQSRKACLTAEERENRLGISALKNEKESK